jgi:hypothetical protein
MFCKVCKDAGKTEAVYTSHWVRNAPGPDGKVVCPTLLRTVCKYCKAKGHVIKFCPKLKGKYVLPPPKQEQQKAPQSQFQQRARELCSSPPPRSEPAPARSEPAPARSAPAPARSEPAPAPYKGTVIPFDPTPIGEKPNYFQSLSVDNERTNSNGAELKSYKKDLDTDFPALGEKNPALGEKKTKKIVNARFPMTIQSYSSKAAATATTAIGTAKYEREDSPTPSPVSSRPHSPPPAPKKMPQVKEEEDAEYCEGAPSPSSLLSQTPPPPPTMTTSWGDMEIDD